MYPLPLTATVRRQDVGLRVGDDVLAFHVTDAYVGRTPGGIEGWRKIGAGHWRRLLKAEAARRGMAAMEAHP